VPEDRHRDALILDFPITDNLALHGAGNRRGRFAPRSLEQRARTLLNAFDVRGGSPRTHVRSLSGGNQQKLVLARELTDAPDLVVAENPTRGLDIRATQEVLNRLREAARSGAAVVMYSADLDEVLALSDRVIAVHAGVVRECEPNRDAVGRAMLGVA
jgi:simple sugar transport system ATP-binding protein